MAFDPRHWIWMRVALLVFVLAGMGRARGGLWWTAGRLRNGGQSGSGREAGVLTPPGATRSSFAPPLEYAARQRSRVVAPIEITAAAATA
ncbi:MAG: hypothetical protein JO304_14415 [Solirubrobacterales bacterium]|nr:hypothetical protein [Solirubrobacterales bacterium]